MRRVTHATEDDDGPRTLCGRPRAELAIDNAAPTCATCRRVIRSRCSDHGVRNCRVCPPGWRIGA
jgi:hypothetical protein